MSDDHGRGAPSFGDLFDDPEAPEAPDAPSAPAPVTPAAAPQAAAEPAQDLVTGHDLDHESDEASHLVAGFEHDEPAAADDDLVEGHDLEHGSDEAAHQVAGFEHDDEDDADDAGDAAPAAAAAAAAAVSVAAAPWDGTPDAVSSAPAARVDTGRLYRSAGAEGPATLDAIPALDPERLAAIEAARPVPPPAASTAPGAATTKGSTVGLTYSGVMVVVIAATVLVAFLEAVVRKEIGWLTGLALLVSTVYAAVFVRRADIWAAVVAPPLAFLVATLTAGQLTLGATGKWLEREGFMIFKSLAVNAPWILASVVVALVIVLVRRHRIDAQQGTASTAPADPAA
ncbi:MAG: DUF6542 domain-containing protein [Candidatus Nanopelagicales bacterium]